MQPDRLLGHRYHRAGFDLFPELLQESFNRNRGFGTAQAFAADANHRRFVGAVEGQRPMEVGVEGHNHASLLKRQYGDLAVAGTAVADVRDVANIDALIGKALHRTARQTLVKKQADQAAPRWTI